MDRTVCPVWVGYLLLSPMRKLSQNPKKIFSPYIREGMQVMDIGCAMGFFSLPAARMVGSNGKVVCVDVQEKMIKSLQKRAKKAGLLNRIETKICTHNSLGLDDFKEKIDFAFAFAVVHEVPAAAAFFSEINETLKPDGKLLIAEPSGHVSEKDFKITVSAAEQNGFKVCESPRIGRSHAVILEKGNVSHL